MGKKILAILSHADDEAVCGWPVLQDRTKERFLLTIATKEKGYLALQKFCDQEGICLIRHEGYRNKFFAEKEIEGKLISLIESAIADVEPDLLFTHNAAGEYGHPDHLLLNKIVVEHFGLQYEILTTDINLISDVYPRRLKKEFGISTKNRLDAGFWDRCKSEYDKFKCWTNNKYIVRGVMDEEVGVYRSNCQYEGGKKVIWLCDTLGWAFANQVREITSKLSDYDHYMVVLKADLKNKIWRYSEQDHEAINNADIVVAMTPGALMFTERRKGIISRLSGVRST